MFSKKLISSTIKNNSDKILKLKMTIDSADAILIGAGAGLSTSAGHHYTGERFYNNFSDFHKKYGINDIYSGGFYPFDTMEEYWAWWSRHIDLNRFREQESDVHRKLLKLIDNKNYFVVTTNVDHLFQSNGFDKNRLFYTQGDYGLFQCSQACHNETYDNKEMVKLMVNHQKNMRIPSKLIPVCPKCGALMTVNLRCDQTFIQDEGWYEANGRYTDFLRNNKNGRIIYLELGVGNNTPSIIKYPFWVMTAQNPLAMYASINIVENTIPNELVNRSICLEDDILGVIESLINL